MALATPEPPGRGPIGRLSSRLSARRWPIVAGAALALAIALTGATAWPAAAVIFVATVVLAALPARAPSAARVVPAAARATVEPPDLARFADALPEPCFILDRRGTVLFQNSLAISTFAIRVGDAITFRLRAPDLVAAFDRVARGGPPERVEFSERVPTERWFAAWFAPLDPAAAQGGGSILLLIDDLSERRNADRVRVDFVANASHELRTPLASLAGFIETLQGSARDDPAARERFLGIMHEQAERMRRIVNDLLSLSRIEMKAHMRPTASVNLADVVRHVIETMEPAARALGVTLEFESPGEPVVVTGDADELTQVFSNLVENACKYGQSGKRVVVSLRDGAEGPLATVRDFGPGIAEEHLPRLTERFYRVDAEESRRHRGTGLGLAIVKHILARHQARLIVESRLGEGAAFTIAFPRSR